METNDKNEILSTLKVAERQDNKHAMKVMGRIRRLEQKYLYSRALLDKHQISMGLFMVVERATESEISGILDSVRYERFITAGKLDI